MIQIFGNGNVQTIDHTNENIENLDYKKFENQDPVLQKFAKAPATDYNEENISEKFEKERIHNLNDHDHYIENPIDQTLNVTSVQQQDPTFENVQNSNVYKTPTDIPDTTKDEIIKQFLLQELQKPPISFNTQHVEKQKVLKDLLSNVISSSDDGIQNNNETPDKTVDIKTYEVTTAKHTGKDNEPILDDNSNVETLSTATMKNKLDLANNEGVDIDVEPKTKEDETTIVKAEKGASAINNNNTILMPHTIKQTEGNLDHLLSSQDKRTWGVPELLDGQNPKIAELVSKTLDFIPDINPTQEKSNNIDQPTEVGEDKNKYPLHIDSTISDVAFVNNKEDANTTSINEGVNGGGPIKSHIVDKSSAIDNDDLSLQTTAESSNIEFPDNKNDVDGNDNKENQSEMESTSPETLMVPKLMAVPNLNLMSGSSDDKNNQVKDNEPESLSGLTMDQVRAMNDQDILQKIEENNTIRPDILDKLNNDPNMMRELLSAPQYIPNIDSVDIAGHTTGTNANIDSPVADLLTNNPLNNGNETPNTSEPSAIDPKLLQSISDAQLQVALISLLASMNPAETNQINLQPTGYGSFLAFIGDIDLNTELVPVQSNPLSRMKGKKMFKEVSKALGNVHSKLPPGTDQVVKAVISATVPGGSEAIEAAELVAEVIKKQKEAKKNRSLPEED